MSGYYNVYAEEDADRPADAMMMGGLDFMLDFGAVTLRGEGMLIRLDSAGRRDVDSDEPGGSRAKHVGYRDLTGQFRASLDRFTGVGVIPFRAIAALIVLYIALIGPLDYFLLRRLTRRMVLPGTSSHRIDTALT